MRLTHFFKFLGVLSASATFFLFSAVSFAASGYGINQYGSGPYNDGVSTSTISSVSASSLQTTSATLSAQITDDGYASSTDKGFYWGTTSLYGNVASSTGSFGIGPFSQVLSGLICATTYHFNAFVINAAGTATSSDHTFQTSSCPVSSSGEIYSSSGSMISQETFDAIFGIRRPAEPRLGSISLSFTRTLTAGQVGTDVKNLQQYLNMKGFVIAKSGPGSKGSETTKFGLLTKQALIKFQRMNGIPATGFFGPITKAFVSSHP